MQRRIFWYEFLLLWGIAVTGTISGLLLSQLPAEALATQLYFPFQSQSTVAVSIALTAQIGLQLAVATGVGLWAAHRVGLRASVLEEWLQRKPVGESLRALLLPVIMAALLVSMFSNLPVLSVLNPNRKERAAELDAFFQTAQGIKYGEQLRKSSPSQPMTRFSQTLTYTDSALTGEIFDALFMLSVFVLLFRQIRGMHAVRNTEFFWAAIIAVAAIRGIDLVAGQLISTNIDQTLNTLMGLHITRDPFSLVAFRGVLRLVPSKVVLGWLYVRYGIEAAILASFLGAVLGYLLLIHLFVYFA